MPRGVVIAVTPGAGYMAANQFSGSVQILEGIHRNLIANFSSNTTHRWRQGDYVMVTKIQKGNRGFVADIQ